MQNSTPINLKLIEHLEEAERRFAWAANHEPLEWDDDAYAPFLNAESFADYKRHIDWAQI